MEKQNCHDASVSKAGKKLNVALEKKSHPDHSGQKKRINRIRGQIEGIDRMVDERRYCVDIITQIKAVRSALGALEAEVVQTHLRACVKNAFNSKNAFDAEEKIDEIMDFIY